MGRLKIVLIILFILSYTIVYLINTGYKNSKINVELKSSVNNLKLHYDITSFYNKKNADLTIYNLRKNKELLSLLSKSLDSNEKEQIVLRKKIYDLFKKRFDTLKKNGVSIFLFAHPDNSAFLRMHKADKYGDDLTNVRYGVSLVNKTKKSISGFEQGKIGHAFRFLYPLYNEDGRYLGCVDVSYSSEFMQRTIDTINKIHSHFLVNKKILNKRIWKSEEINNYYKPSIEHKNYMIAEIKEVNHKKKKVSMQIIADNQNYISERIDSLKEFAIYGLDDNEALVISFVPITSIENKKTASAYIVSYTSNNEIKNIISTFFIINSFSFILLLIAIYLIYKQLMHKTELRLEVSKKTKELKSLNENLEERILIESEKNRKKDKQLYEQAKNAQMGEMIGNIAHQWRQPLSIISTIASGLVVKIEYGIYEKKDAIKDLDKLNNTAQHLSQTIDIFRDFIKDNKSQKEVVLQDRIDYALTLIETSSSQHFIKIINEVNYKEPIKINLIEGELSQVLMNIFNNSIDAFNSLSKDDKWIKIGLKVDSKKIVLSIEDNAGGIPEDIIQKVFDPYFTTKHQAQGTGIGLYMSAQIVQKHMNGKIFVNNTSCGAKFFIEIPFNS